MVWTYRLDENSTMEIAPKATAETPAAKAIRLLGAKRIAACLDLTTDAVWKWRSAYGGYIPARYQARVHALAIERGVSLSAAEIIGIEAAA